MRAANQAMRLHFRESGKARCQQGGVSVHILLLLTFALALLTLNWPLLSILAQDGGISLFLYFFVVWGALIALLWLAGKRLRKPDNTP